MRLYSITILLFNIIVYGTCVIDAPYFQGESGEIQYFDTSSQMLNTSIAHSLKTKYLQIFEGKVPTSYNGVIWGPNQRVFVAMPVRLSKKRCPISINVIFKVDTGSPVTILNKEVADRLHLNCGSLGDGRYQPYDIYIGGRYVMAYSSRKNYYKLNVLGADFMRQVNGRLTVDYSKYLYENVNLTFDVNDQNNDL